MTLLNNSLAAQAQQGHTGLGGLGKSDFDLPRGVRGGEGIRADRQETGRPWSSRATEALEGGWEVGTQTRPKCP